MREPNETLFRDANIMIIECIRNFDDEILDRDEEEAKEDLRNLCEELIDLYKR